MTDVKHTPGPWLAKMEIRGLRPYEFYYIVPAVAPFGMIARVHVYAPGNQPFACGKGNASLIAAAPELLEAHEPDASPSGPDFLDWLADRLVNVYGESESTDFVQTLRRKAVKARSAIAKAVGVP